MKKNLLGDEFLIIFARIGEITFGVDIQAVNSILEPKNLRRVPFAPTFINSILNCYGRIVTILDLNILTDYEDKTPVGEKKIVYLRHPKQHIGLLVNSITSIDYVSPTCVESIPEADSGKPKADFSQGMFILEKDAPGVYWLDPKKVERFIDNMAL